MMKNDKMSFDQFKKEWSDAMVYNPNEFDYENKMHELYIEYKEGLESYGKNFSVSQWCYFFHQDCDLDTHPYMIKSKAINTHHGNGLKEFANRFRKNTGLPLIPLIDKK
jgi:hypothetical protein